MTTPAMKNQKPKRNLFQTDYGGKKKELSLSGGTSLETKRVYEALFLVDSALAAAQWDHVMELVQRMLDRCQASVISIRKWDERKLAYATHGKARGTYILAYFECLSSAVAQIERDVRLSEEILRALVIRTDRMTREDMDKPTPAMLGRSESESTPADLPAEEQIPVPEITESF
jgi:small subunit ribosomal protein S6